jgi:hypothetical protein
MWNADVLVLQEHCLTCAAAAADDDDDGSSGASRLFRAQSSSAIFSGDAYRSVRTTYP